MYGPKFDSAEEGSGEWGHDLMLHWSKMVERGWPARFIDDPSPSSLSIWNLSRVHRLNYIVLVLPVLRSGPEPRTPRRTRPGSCPSCPGAWPGCARCPCPL